MLQYDKEGNKDLENTIECHALEQHGQDFGNFNFLSNIIL